MKTCVLSNRCERLFNMLLRCGGVDLSTAGEDEYISAEQIQCFYLFPNPVDQAGLVVGYVLDFHVCRSGIEPARQGNIRPNEPKMHFDFMNLEKHVIAL